MDTVKKRDYLMDPCNLHVVQVEKRKKEVIAYITKKINDVGFDTICEIAKRKKVQDAREMELGDARR